MDNPFNLLNVILLLGASQGIFLSVLLLNQHKNKSANKYLATILLVYSAFIVESSLSGTVIGRQLPHLLGLAAGVIFLIGPLHYFYSRSMISSGLPFSAKQLLHFIPFFAFYLYNLFPYYLKSGEYKIEYIQKLAEQGQPLSIILFNWLAVIQGIVYMAVTLIYLKQYSQDIKDRYSTIDRINLNWLFFITRMTLAVWSLGFVVKLSELFGVSSSFEALIPLSIAVLVYAMGYLGLSQPEIITSIEEPKGMKKYERSGLTKEKAQNIHDKLIKLMDTEKPYTDSNLKLNQLSAKLSVTPNHLSQVLNDMLQQNFFDFVNRYRIEESKRMIADTSQQQYTLLSIAYEVGFNSKSAFYAAFKKHTSMTPSQFKKQSM